MSAKITQLNERVALTGLEEVPVAIDGGNARVKLNRVKTLVTKTDVGLGNVDNTSDADKPVSNAQAAALNQKANTVHSHTVEQITGLSSALSAKADSSHGHVLSDIAGLAGALDGKANASHTHLAQDIDGLSDMLADKANVLHNHEISQVNGLDSALSGLQTQINQKASVAHTHGAADINGLPEAINDAVAAAVAGIQIDASQILNFTDAAITAVQSAGYPGLTAQSLPGFDERVLELIDDNGSGGTSDIEVGELAW